MDKKNVLGALAGISFAAILFTPLGSTIWKFPFMAGLVFGVAWFFIKD